MSNDIHRVTKVTRTSWGGRLSGAAMGLMFGFVLFVLSFPLLWWNEGRALDRALALEEGQGQVIAVPSEAPDPENEGRLVHITGMASTEKPLIDPLTGVQAQALQMRRIVEMYQWREEKHEESEKNLGGSETKITTYTYSKGWSETPIASSRFAQPQGHENPAAPAYASQRFTAKDAKIGAFSLASSFVGQLTRYEAFPVPEGAEQGLNEGLRGVFALRDGGFLKGDPAAPKVGDIRIRFEAVKLNELSAIGKQAGSGLKPYYSKHGDLTLIDYGTIGPDEMFRTAARDNQVITWAVRMGGIVLMWIGLMMMFSLLRTLADVVPLLGEIVGAGAALLCAIIAISFGSLTIAIAWMALRPLIGIGLLALSAGLIWWGRQWLKYRKKVGPASAVALPD